jgi:anti-sigma factor RsiW
MNHPKLIKLSLYRDNMLDEKSKKEIHEHLADCEKCRQKLDEWDWIARQAKQTLEPAIPAQFRYQIMQRIQKNKSSFWDQFILLPGLWKPAVAVIAICVIFLTHQMTLDHHPPLEINNVTYSLWTGPMDEPALTNPEQALVVALIAPTPQSGE